MVFSSFEFLCIFLPVLCIVYAILPSIRWKNGLLIIGSLLFYAYGEPVYVLLMIGSSLVHYLLAMGISKSASAKKPLLALDVILSLVVLGLFKYTGMIVTTINQIAHSNIPVPAIVMPIGISFFTFQSMSYVIDVYRERVEVQTNFFKVLLYISFFPQLIAGPIVKYRDISKEKMFEGESFSKVIKETQIYSPLHARMIMIAERTGETDQALSKIAVQVDEEVTAEIQNFVSVIEPTMVIILSILVGALLLSVMMPLMGILSVIG